MRIKVPVPDVAPVGTLAELPFYLAGRFDRPVLIHRYPADIKAFYMKRDPADPRLIRAPARAGGADGLSGAGAACPQ